MTATTQIRRLDVVFEHSLVKVISNRNLDEIDLAGLRVGPFEEGNEYEVYYWVADELQKAGIVRLREDDMLDSSKLYKIQWKERAQTTGQISHLEEGFYPKLRRYMKALRTEAVKAPEKIIELEKTKQLTKDIVNSRLRKIVSVASAPTQTEQMLKNFTPEERYVYMQLCKLISEWRTHIVEQKETEE
jgi:hypothetical protein